MWATIISILFSPLTILVGTLLVALYMYGTSTFGFFDKRGIPYEKPVPFFGNFFSIATRKQTLPENIIRLHKQFKNESVYGVFQFRQPLLLITEPELIKRITIKDFDHFIDHSTLFDTQDSLIGKSLSILTGQRWKEMRSALTPAFTGSKIRQMLQLVNECNQRAVNYLLKEAKAKGKDPFVPEMKDVYSRIANDVIATCAFGIEVNSLEDQDNEFFKMGAALRDVSRLQGIKIMIMVMLPKLSRLLKFKFFNPKIDDFFRRIVRETIQARERNGIVRYDMIHLLMEIKNGSLKSAENEENNVGIETGTESSKKQNWDDDDLTAQCLIFFFAGFELISTALSLASHELCVNSDVQTKLLEEIDAVRNELGDKPLTYEVLQKMKYLDMVISETLRKWPVTLGLDRLCVKPYVFEDKHGRKIEINAGDSIAIPAYASHQDPDIFSEPNKFDPERFSDENSDSIKITDYVPFGLGPRNCIGSRFALMECKAVLFHMLSNFTFEVSEKTQIPLKVNITTGLKAEKGYNIHLKPRKVTM